MTDLTVFLWLKKQPTAHPVQGLNRHIYACRGNISTIRVVTSFNLAFNVQAIGIIPNRSCLEIRYINMLFIMVVNWDQSLYVH